MMLVSPRYALMPLVEIEGGEGLSAGAPRGVAVAGLSYALGVATNCFGFPSALHLLPAPDSSNVDGRLYLNALAVVGSVNLPMLAFVE